MKFTFIKNNPSMKLRASKRDGFALLFSVLVSSLLLTIGLSILNVALKELAISTASRQSIYAFYAADSGREYALYTDTKSVNFFTYNNEDLWTPPDVIKNSITDLGIDLGGPNFTVTIHKTKASGVSKIDTTITSVGHDTDSGDIVERAIFQSY